MYRSARPYIEQAAIAAPVICYQGAAVVDPANHEYLFHQPLPLDIARDAIAALVELGYGPNVYVDDALFVGEHNEWTRRYGAFQRIEITEVGDLESWLDREPTKIVAVGEPTALPALREQLVARLGSRVFLTRSLPHLLELGHPSVSKGTGLAFVADRLGLDLDGVVAFGDGENDLELLQTAGWAVAIEGSEPALLELADATCPGPGHEGVAAMIETVLDSLS